MSFISLANEGLSSEVGVSVVLWVDPLVLVSFTQAVGNFVSGLQEVLHDGIVRWVLVEVHLGDVKSLQLLDGEVIMGNLWEGERFLIDLGCVYVDWEITVSLLLNFTNYLDHILEMLSVQSNAEAI